MTIEEQARQARNEYAREWRRKNPEKARAANMRYWAKKAAEAVAREAEDGAEDKQEGKA